MPGRSLVRILDMSVAAIVIAALTVLGVIAWAARLSDNNTFRTESAIIRHELGEWVMRYREELPKSSDETLLWRDERPQSRALLVQEGRQLRFEGHTTASIEKLIRDPATLQRLAEALEFLTRFDPKRHRVDFFPAGPAGGEEVLLIAQAPGENVRGLLVAVLDIPALAGILEPFGVRLKTDISPRGVMEDRESGLVLENFNGDSVGALRWTSDRVAIQISHFVYPALTAILLFGYFVLTLLKRRWELARRDFDTKLRLVESAALSDPLTGLPNRRALFEWFHGIEARGQVDPVTLVMLDLSGIKWINETLGYHVGDQLIVRAAAALAEIFGKEVFLARMEGDVFVAIVPGNHDLEWLETVHRRIMRQLRDLAQAEDRRAVLSANIGAVCSSVYPGTCAEWLRFADLAVISAKQHPTGAVRFYDPSMRAEKLARRQIERELTDALDRDELVLVHQPIVDALNPAHCLGHESLVRWNHPTRGLIGPAEFIPIAEQSDLIVRLGNQVLEKALRELGPRSEGRISVNATARQLLAPGFADFVERVLAQYQVPAHRLCLELTETSLVEDGEAVAAMIDTLRAKGLMTAIDDFGVGYSSLSHLLRFKFDILKIDRDFVVGLDNNAEAPMIITAVVALARSLGMQVVGEGIETPAQQRFLASAGCNALQGYLFGRPVPVSKLDLAPENSRLSTIQAA